MMAIIQRLREKTIAIISWLFTVWEAYVFLMIAIISWLFTGWVAYVFLGSLYYKFDVTATEPIHIFSTIGAWMNDVFGPTIGGLFAEYGQYVIGGAELITVLILLSPLLSPKRRAKLHASGALMASAVMAGAVFFHLFTPLGWVPTWTVDGTTYMDTALANAALSILILGLLVAFLNKKSN